MLRPAHQHLAETRALRHAVARNESEFEPEHGSNATDFGIDVTAVPVNGTPLDAATRTRMEARFGHDFSAVRAHVGPAADTSARTMRARAYTVGTDLVFRDGAYRPGTSAGDHLLAHELAHVVQQSRARPDTETPVSAMEHDAHRAADQWAGTGAVRVTGQSPVRVACLDEDEPTTSAAPQTPAQAPEPGSGVTLAPADNKRFTNDRAAVDFYVKYSELALADQAKTGVPALLTLGQMVLESGWKPGPQASFFGVKADPDAPPETIRWQWTPEFVVDREKVRQRYRNYEKFEEKEPVPGADRYMVKLPFRRHDSVADAIAGHSKTLLAKNYSKAWANTADPEAFAKAVTGGGYGGGTEKANQASYGATLIDIMRTLNKAAAYAREHKLLDPVRQIIHILEANRSSAGYQQARELLPSMIPNYFVLSEESQRAEIEKIRERLVGAGQPPEVAAEVCRP
ncbi:DUF4157 domain-containing protein [Nocardia sp. NPDC049149]|uniref:eCIS core domain-containing protein n=1 Tax=Nocardia sp. NPDC049149 TaxID=3364315 RepID=UPI00371BEFD8